jgi:rhamnogalacturonan endolyase
MHPSGAYHDLARPALFCSVLSVLAALFLSLGSLHAAENLDRASVVLPAGEGKAYVGWRALAEDPPKAGFEVLRRHSDGGAWQKRNGQPIRESSNFLDATAGKGTWEYAVCRVGEAPAERDAVRVEIGVKARPYLSIRLQGSYRAQKVGLGDFDGDGRLDYLVKQPDFNTDPYQRPGYWKRSTDTYKLEAYRHDGAFLWRYDMGWAIEEGIWYSPVVVYDLDEDGRAEVYCKAGEGDPREPTGHVTSGQEYLVKLDGRTGKVLQRVPWPSREGIDRYNYYSRNLLGIAYLDGVHPHLVVQRGTYTLIKVEALNGELNRVWTWESKGPDARFRGQGMHGMHAADLDEDGRDELVLGSGVLDDSGRGLWCRGVGHPDACYVADIDPTRAGQEIFFGIEPRQKSNAVCLVEARTGELIWGNPEPTVHVHSQGMVGDIDPTHPGMECYAGEAKGGDQHWLYTAQGERLSDETLGELAPKAIWWLDGPTKVYIVGRTMYRYPREEVELIEGRIVAIADCLGDWREEVITSLAGEIRVYSTVALSQRRRTCLMQDRQYRNGVAVQTMGYFYPPQLSEAL